MSSPSPPHDERRVAAIGAGLDAVRARIEAGCSAVGRNPAEVTLIVVTKTYPARDVIALRGLGVSDVGENRDQEASVKRVEVDDIAGAADVRAPGSVNWHMIGRLQTNKCRSVASWADAVHSLDRLRVVDALDRASLEAGRRIPALIQVSLDDDPDRGGAAPADVERMAERIADSEALDLKGVMAVAPLGVDPPVAFARLAGIAERLRQDHPGAGWISAGMSQDLEAALAAGATHVRVGSAVLGARPALR